MPPWAWMLAMAEYDSQKLPGMPPRADLNSNLIMVSGLLKSVLQSRLPQRLRALEVGIDLGFDFADDGQVAVDFGDDSNLFSHRRHRHPNRLKQ